MHEEEEQGSQGGCIQVTMINESLNRVGNKVLGVARGTLKSGWNQQIAELSWIEGL